MGRVIVAAGLSKRYRISPTVEPPGGPSVRDLLHRLVTAPWRRLRGKGPPAAQEFWALRDASFEIDQGETVGLVGRNGAGKSTLLKILSLITRPTGGRLRICGRVGSLLELGIGFHGELSGRENVYLSGALLGLPRRQIQRRLDEIVAFAGVEEFLDTPLKRYSSGMVARLAFAVASHLESEILMVDEALSVGDVPFQARCSERMARLAEAGRTVLFVSHNLGALSNLCRRGLFLERGRLVADGPMEDVLAAYVKSLDARPAAAAGAGEAAARPGKGEVRLVAVEVCGADGAPTARLIAGGPARFAFRVSEPREGLSCTFALVNGGGQPVTQFRSRVRSPADVIDATLGPRFVCDVEPLLLLPGSYRLNVRLSLAGETQDSFFGAASFEVLPGHVGGRPVAASNLGTSLTMPHRWTLPS
jgi:lipopolysaccharide transport system ATP-binding protein